LESEVQIRTSDSAGSIEHSGINGDMKTLKLPTFNEDKDDLDAYFNRFELPAGVKYVRLADQTVS